MVAAVSSQGTRSLLNADQVEASLSQLKDWRVDGKELTRSYKFKDFTEAVNFVNAIARVAESQDHHPDLLVRWGEVVVRVTTHSAGGLTAKDFSLAAAIDRLQNP
jgi:4a-hydroxytetrahydrobiopterin dehydratase